MLEKRGVSRRLEEFVRMGETLSGCFPQQCPQRAWQGVCSDAQGTGLGRKQVPGASSHPCSMDTWHADPAPAASQLRLLLGQPEESPQHLSRHLCY